VLDPKLLPVAEIARLYTRRWDIEMAIKLVKREQGLHLLWSTKTEVILAQVWAVLCIAQILQALRQEVAGRAGVDAFDVLMSLLVQ
jgi:IS4 transposase